MRVRMFSRSRRAQAAMEFLMTYGWAILVVLGAITALAYFGVMSPAKFFPEACTLSSTAGMACMDFRVDTDAAYLLIMNSGGRDVMINNVTVGDCTADFSLAFPDGRQNLFNISGCSFGSKGSSVKLDVLISYTNQMSGFTKSISGSLSARIN